MAKKLTHEEIKEKVKKISKGNFELLDTIIYKSKKENIVVRNLNTKKDFLTTWSNFKDWKHDKYNKVEEEYSHIKLKKEICSIYKNKYILLDNIIYENKNTKLKVLDLNCKNIIEISGEKLINYLKKGKELCKHCETKEKVRKKSNNRYELLDDVFYSRNSDLLKFKDKVCNKTFFNTLLYFNKYMNTNTIFCEHCKQERNVSHEEMKVKILKETNHEYGLLDTIQYIDVKGDIYLKHFNCGHTFKTKLRNLRQNNKKNAVSCPECNPKLKTYTHEEMKELINFMTNGEYELLDTTLFKIKTQECDILHRPCNNIFPTKIHKFLENIEKNRISCKNCQVKSKGEKYIEDYFIDKNILFSKEKKFKNCIYRTYLKFDFYIKTEKIIIEYDGRQHFIPIDYFGGEEHFKEIKERDKIKNNYCKDNDILLLRIPHTEQNNIETILDNFLHSDNKYDFLINYYNGFKEFYNVDDIIPTQQKKTS